MGLVLAAAGIPHMFMGQEILEDKPWSDTPSSATEIWRAGLDAGDENMSDFPRFTRELIATRRAYPAFVAKAVPSFTSTMTTAFSPSSVGWKVSETMLSSCAD